MSARTKPKTVEEILRAHQFKKVERVKGTALPKDLAFVCKAGCRVWLDANSALMSEVEATHQAAMLEEASP